MTTVAGQEAAQRSTRVADSYDLVLYRGGAGGARGVGGLGMGNASVRGYNSCGHTNYGMRMSRTVRYDTHTPNGLMVCNM